MSRKAQWLRVTPAEFPPLQRTVDEIQHSAERFIAAIEGDRIIGAIGVEPAAAATWSGVKLDCAHIASLTVVPKRQRQGVGRRLTEAAIESNGDAPMTVSTAIDNTPALLLYQRFAFTEINRRTIVCGGRALELILLRRVSAR